MPKLKFGQISLRDYEPKEAHKRLNEKFEIHKFKYIDDTLTSEEQKILRKYGTKFQMFVDGLYRDGTEEYEQIINGSDKTTGSVSKEVQVWFKYQSMLKDENKGREAENIRLAKENENRFRPYHGE